MIQTNRIAWAAGGYLNNTARLVSMCSPAFSLKKYAPLAACRQEASLPSH
ncbi:MAG: hypothetical protein AB7V45_00095 [Candidatus Krumholzibacteriia bacterium]